MSTGKNNAYFPSFIDSSELRAMKNLIDSSTTLIPSSMKNESTGSKVIREHTYTVITEKHALSYEIREVAYSKQTHFNSVTAVKC